MKGERRGKSGDATAGVVGPPLTSSSESELDDVSSDGVMASQLGDGTGSNNSSQLLP